MSRLIRSGPVYSVTSDGRRSERARWCASVRNKITAMNAPRTIADRCACEKKSLSCARERRRHSCRMSLRRLEQTNRYINWIEKQNELPTSDWRQVDERLTSCESEIANPERTFDWFNDRPTSLMISSESLQSSLWDFKTNYVRNFCDRWVVRDFRALSFDKSEIQYKL